MLNKRLALLPGVNYKYNGKTRRFEAVIIAGQYWLKGNWWVLGGTGLTFDTPAFYMQADTKAMHQFLGFLQEKQRFRSTFYGKKRKTFNRSW